MRNLLLAALIVSLSGTAFAGPNSVVVGTEGGGAMFGMPDAGGMLGFLNFVRWSAREEAAPLLAGHQPLAVFRKLNYRDESQLRALSPMIERLNDEQRARLANVEKLGPEEQKAALQDLEAVVRRAGSDVGEAVLKRVAAAKQDESTDWNKLAAEVRPLAIYGSWAEPVAKKLEARGAAVKAMKTETAVRDIAEKLKGKTAEPRVLRVEGNVVHVDFSRREAPKAEAKEGGGATVIGMPAPEERTPPRWAVEQYKGFKRQVNNNEILLDSDLGKNAGKIQEGLRARREENLERMRSLEARYPRLSGRTAAAPARRIDKPRVDASAQAEYLRRFEARRDEARSRRMLAAGAVAMAAAAAMVALWFLWFS